MVLMANHEESRTPATLALLLMLTGFSAPVWQSSKERGSEGFHQERCILLVNAKVEHARCILLPQQSVSMKQQLQFQLAGLCTNVVLPTCVQGTISIPITMPVQSGIPLLVALGNTFDTFASLK